MLARTIRRVRAGSEPLEEDAETLRSMLAELEQAVGEKAPVGTWAFRADDTPAD